MLKKITYAYKKFCMLIYYLLNKKEILKTLSGNKEYVNRLRFYKITNKVIQYKMIIMAKDLQSKYKVNIL